MIVHENYWNLVRFAIAKLVTLHFYLAEKPGLRKRLVLRGDQAAKLQQGASSGVYSQWEVH